MLIRAELAIGAVVIGIAQWKLAGRARPVHRTVALALKAMPLVGAQQAFANRATLVRTDLREGRARPQRRLHREDFVTCCTGVLHKVKCCRESQCMLCSSNPEEKLVTAQPEQRVAATGCSKTERTSAHPGLEAVHNAQIDVLAFRAQVCCEAIGGEVLDEDGKSAIVIALGRYTRIRE